MRKTEHLILLLLKVNRRFGINYNWSRIGVRNTLSMLDSGVIASQKQLEMGKYPSSQIWEFARWKVRNTAIERRDLLRNPVPLMPEFQRSIRLLGRRPTTQQFIDTIIKKYGTHILISATLGGEEALTMYMDKSRLDRKSGNATQSVEALHQLASSYFVDRDGTMRRLHEIQISTGAIKVTETRTGPLGCNSYDNLDSVSSVLLQSTESKLHLQEQAVRVSYFFLVVVGGKEAWERTIQQWLTRVQSLLYCNENGFWGTFLESQRSCVCHGSTTLCQRPIPCIIGSHGGERSHQSEIHLRTVNGNKKTSYMQNSGSNNSDDPNVTQSEIHSKRGSIIQGSPLRETSPTALLPKTWSINSVLFRLLARTRQLRKVRRMHQTADNSCIIMWYEKEGQVGNGEERIPDLPKQLR
ncbi:Deleted in bladder cancer protein 1 like protein [Chelonia mydas]|uniref:BMP/retinoic acid-inducible neural-specific protein 1 n=1 Tax=Chelonia mydas TaxID=8469 RepID=M7BLJ8_CHEMY|nr:Deleted in bladder cancer protein 1 like protein [Chelonia mydas]